MQLGLITTAQQGWERISQENHKMSFANALIYSESAWAKGRTIGAKEPGINI